ncbi:MAG: hypothetical protein CTY12_06370 [Methylotenera sp.]|nr:MAG: hypothetical protein CTY12_06370 [Methylotenera sp.]
MGLSVITKQEAKHLGFKTYFTGNVCKRGHLSERYLNGDCVACLKARSHTWLKNNSDKVSEYNKQARINNPEKFKARAANYYKQNSENIKNKSQLYRDNYRKMVRERNKEQTKRYRLKNSFKTIFWNRTRRLILKQATPLWYEHELVELLYTRCKELNQVWNVNLVVDHIIPINPRDNSVCGLHCWANLQLLDSSLNSSKMDFYNEDW